MSCTAAAVFEQILERIGFADPAHPRQHRDLLFVQMLVHVFVEASFNHAFLEQNQQGIFQRLASGNCYL